MKNIFRSAFAIAHKTIVPRETQHGRQGFFYEKKFFMREEIFYERRNFL